MARHGDNRDWKVAVQVARTMVNDPEVPAKTRADLSNLLGELDGIIFDIALMCWGSTEGIDTARK